MILPRIRASPEADLERTPMNQQTPPVASEPTPTASSDPFVSVETTMAFSATPEQVWERLMFYEEVDLRPPLHLRLLLPVPIETVGRKSEVGDEARCLYEGGHLIKRVTAVEPGVRYAFDVTEQELELGGGMRLSGGEYSLRELGSGRVEVRAVTRYSSPKRPRWLWRPVEEAVCHAFHRHILRAMKRGVEGAA